MCVSMHMCVSLLKLADFVAGWWLSDRAREAEWQEGISIWNFNKDGKGKRCQPACWCERCVCLTMFALCTRACVHPSPPDFGNLIWGMLTRTKDGVEQNTGSISPPKKMSLGGVKWIRAHWKLLFQLYPIRLELRQTKSFNAIELPALF